MGFAQNLLQSITGGGLQLRGADIPLKVFVENDGPARDGTQYLYSEQQPNMFEFNRLMDNFQGMHGGLGSYNMLNLFYCLPEITGAVHVIAKAVADATWQLCMFKDDQVVYSDTNFNRLFSQPNPLDSIRELIYTAVCIEILTGKQFFYFNRPNTLGAGYENILSWYNLPAGQVVVNMNSGADPYSATELKDYVKDYQYNERHFSVDKVLPIVNMDISRAVDLNTTNSLLKGADKAIKNLLAVYEARGTIYVKRGAMGMWVSKKSDSSGTMALTPGENKAARDEINRDYGVTGNRSTVGITSVPIDFIKTSMSLAEMLPFEETLADAVAIYSTLGIPRSMVPSGDQSTFNNVDSDKKEFYGNVVIPWGQRYADSFTNFLRLKDNRRYIKADYSHISVMQENKKDKALVDKTNGDVYLQRWLNSVWTLNDWIKAVDGVPGIGTLYENKILDLTDEEIIKVKAIVNFKTVTPTTNEQPTTANSGN